LIGRRALAARIGDVVAEVPGIDRAVASTDRERIAAAAEARRYCRTIHVPVSNELKHGAIAMVGESKSFASIGFSREDLGLPAIAEPPLNDIEAGIIRLFSESFDLTDLGATDSFFALGGDSLHAESLLSAIKRDFGVDFPSSTLLEASTPRALAALIVEALK
jgi:acyl carrier protein